MNNGFKGSILKFISLSVILVGLFFLCGCPNPSFLNNPYYQKNTQWISDDGMYFINISDDNYTYGYIMVGEEKYPVEYNFVPGRVCIHDINSIEDTLYHDLVEFSVDKFEPDSFSMKAKKQKEYSFFDNGKIHISKISDNDKIDFSLEKYKSETPYKNGRIIFENIFEKLYSEGINKQYDYNNDSVRIVLELASIGCGNIEAIKELIRGEDVVSFELQDDNGSSFNVEYDFNERYVVTCKTVDVSAY